MVLLPEKEFCTRRVDNIDNGILTTVCFLDIKKCFDSIDHDILIAKLCKYGIWNMELQWFKSYLQNRRQAVVSNGELSEFML